VKWQQTLSLMDLVALCIDGRCNAGFPYRIAVAKALSTFKGVQRRFSYKKLKMYDFYLFFIDASHFPSQTEINCSLLKAIFRNAIRIKK